MTDENTQSSLSSQEQNAQGNHGTANGPTPYERHITNSIASNISEPGIGDMVAEKRANLLRAQGEPQIGRREPPPPDDPRPRRIKLAKGILAGVVVIVIAVVILMALASSTSLG